jgi:uncharacterized protein YndB with AHSA1/START domain
MVLSAWHPTDRPEREAVFVYHRPRGFVLPPGSHWVERQALQKQQVNASRKLGTRWLLHPTGDQYMSARSVRLHRVLRTSPEKVYRAFVEAHAMSKWLPPYGFTCTVHHMDARVGGTFRMSFHNFTTGHGHSFGGEYLELLPHERIRYTDKFDDPDWPGVMEVTVSLTPVLCGTELSITSRGA